jgi:hypothetical protein
VTDELYGDLEFGTDPAIAWQLAPVSGVRIPRLYQRPAFLQKLITNLI